MNAQTLLLAASTALTVAADENPTMVTIPVTMPTEKAVECQEQTCIILTEKEVLEIFRAGVDEGAASCRRSNV